MGGKKGEMRNYKSTRGRKRKGRRGRGRIRKRKRKVGKW